MTTSICLVAHFAYAALTGRATGHIGGVERQTTLMARWLTSRGHDVTLLTWDEGQQDGVEVDGVRVLTICRHAAGWPGVRFVHPRWTGLAAAMARADAQVYYQNCGEAVTGQVALWCRQHRRSFVYSVAADPDCDPALPLMTRRERLLYRFGLHHADAIIVQTETQRRMLRDEFALRSVVLPMPCPGPDEHEFVAPAAPIRGSGRALWLARVATQKRPDRVLTLAAQCPDIHFDLVGPVDDSFDLRDLLAQAAALGNLRILGPASRDRVHELFRHAHCLCSTSDYEGFPNTYLEAWSYGLPVVALVDPDGLIARRNLGVAGATVDDLADGIHGLFSEPQRWQAVSTNARQYYLERHTVDDVMRQFEQILLDHGARRAVPTARARAQST